ncbi:MAG: GAF domain-containing protein [Blastochloris sp.]|nr:GAF domain-containing protein [Blastochloris sp.]
MLTLQLGALLDLKTLRRELPTALRSLTGSDRVTLLLVDAENARLEVAALTDATPIDALPGVSLFLSDPLTAPLKEGASVSVCEQVTPESVFFSLMTNLSLTTFIAVPLRHGDELVGVVLADNRTAPISDSMRATLEAVAPSAAIVLKNAIQHSRIVSELDAKMYELSIMRQIDRELSDTIELSHVFALTLDWAIRYTGGLAASLAVFDDVTDELRFVDDLGYSVSAQQLALVRAANGSGIAYRAARSGRTEVVPDVSVDHDYVELMATMRSHMSVPVKREERVIAVLTVESRKLNAFTDEHVDFIEKLAARAGVAIDNARLYAESQRERDKLAHILRDIVDVVVVVGNDDRIVMVNKSALAAMRLPERIDYTGQSSAAIFEETPLIDVFNRAKTSERVMVEQVQLPDGRTYYVNIAPRPAIGWIIVMHDITPLKETDELKSQLIGNVSHDLKQPLSVINGYIELLQMTQPLTEKSQGFVGMMQRQVTNMRLLINDLLDSARIEAGMLKLDIAPLQIGKVIGDCVQDLLPIVEGKAMRMDVNVPANLPTLHGDFQRLKQIFNNLISNAIKYTPPEGRIQIAAEATNDSIRIAVIDNGIGISPEDQARIFERFYRVRHAETETIEGTGLGLALVKKLVEAHGGQLGLESALGEGSTFTVTLPLTAKPQMTEDTSTM